MTGFLVTSASISRIVQSLLAKNRIHRSVKLQEYKQIETKLFPIFVFRQGSLDVLLNQKRMQEKNPESKLPKGGKMMQITSDDHKTSNFGTALLKLVNSHVFRLNTYQ